MAWVLRVTNIVPFSNRMTYEGFLEEALGVGGTADESIYPDKMKLKKQAAKDSLSKEDKDHLKVLKKKGLGSGGKTKASDPDIEHLGSYRVTIGNTMEYMHLFRLASPAVLAQGMDVCKVLAKMYFAGGEDLVSESRYELLKEITQKPDEDAGTAS